MNKSNIQMKKTTGWSVDENPVFSGLFCINQT